MQLYQGSAYDFINETTRNQIANDLRNAYFSYYGFAADDSQIRAWRNSLKAMKDVFLGCNLKNQGISLEYFLPGTSQRLDVLVTGHNKKNEESALIIELKQWDDTSPCESENEVVTRINGRYEELLHPCAQVNGYKEYLANFVEEFYKENSIKLNSCVYLHNYKFKENDPILDNKFDKLIKENPLFGEKDFNEIKNYVLDEVSHGEGMKVLDKVINSRKRPSKKLLNDAYNIIHNNEAYNLIDEQQIVFDKTMTQVRKAIKDKSRKHVIIVKGGPGTGKSVIAINLLAKLFQEGKWAEYVTGSASFTQSYKKAIGGAVKNLFKYTNSYVLQKDIIDCLIVDEAHRLREKAPAGSFYSKIYSGKTQVEEIIDACRVALFFIDDNQQVKPDEIGTSIYIKEQAEKLGCDVSEY